MIKLTDLDPRWVGAGGTGVYNTNERGELVPAPARHGVAISFLCPCANCQARVAKDDPDHNWDLRVVIEFDVPLDGLGPHRTDGHTWQRTGDTFETLTLRPSILRIGGCGWHGFVTEGMVTTA